MLSGLQRDLIFPGHKTQGKTEAEFAAPRNSERLVLRSKAAERIAAIYGPALDRDGLPVADPRSRPSLLFFYGNGMHLAATLDLFDFFRRLGANVLVPEYLGYGLSEGTASDQGGLATAEAAYDHLIARPETDSGKIVPSGWSLGAASALHLAATRKTAGVAIFSAFVSLNEMVRQHFPIVPLAMLEHQFDNAKAISRIDRPIFLGHGARDELIPISHAETLTRAAKGPVTSLILENAGHNDFFFTGWKPLTESFGSWLNSLPTAPQVEALG